MVLKFWLIIGEDESVSARKRTPASGSLTENEIAIPLTVRVPDSWFSQRAPVTTIEVPEPPAYVYDIAVEADMPLAPTGAPSATFGPEDFEQEEMQS